MKKTRKTIAIVSVVILLVVSLALTLTSCALGGYKLIFDVDGAVVKTIDFTSGGALELPDTPIKVGYTFGGWYFDKDALNDPCTAETLKGKKFKGDTIVYAKWLKNDYSITYNLNGGENAKANPSGYAVDTATFTLAAPTKLGYTFGGWYDNAEFKGNAVTEIAKGSTVNMTLFAKWTMTDFAIIYNLDGGINGANPTTYTLDTATFTLADPTWVGYTFGGWFDNAEFKGNAITEIAKGSAGDMTLFAKWTAIEYKLTYNLNGGVLTGTYPTTYTTDKDTTLAAPTKLGYTFEGWCEKADLTDTPIKATAKGTTSEKTLYAKWTKDNYTITYDLDGGREVTANPTTYAVDTATFTLAPPTKLGYTFGGWFGKANFEGTAVTEIALGSTGNKTLFAKWTKDTYTITYNLDGGREVTANPTTYAVDTATFTLADPIKEGYTFGGWFEDDKFLKVITEISTRSTGNMTLFAKWTKDTYNIAYVGADGVGALNPNAFTNYTIESNTIHIAPASWKEGAEFIGWSIDGNVANATTTRTIPKGSTGNVTLTAHWTFTTYAIIYELDGGTNYYTHPSSYNIDTATITLKEPTHTESATFVGWYKSATGNDKITTIDRGTTGDLTIYARWDYYATPGLTYKLINGDTEYEVSKGTVDKSGVTIPRRHDDKLVTRIASFGFEKIAITNIYIPNGVKSIGESAFFYCRSLRDVTIPESVTSIERSTFHACNALLHAILPSNLKIIPESMFGFCYALWYVRMPLNVETISGGAFQDCRLLEGIDIPDSVTSIWGSAFAGCKILPSIFIPKGVTTIGSSAFDRCFALRISCEIAETAVPIPDDPHTTGWHAKWMGVTDPVTSDRISWSQTRPTPKP